MAITAIIISTAFESKVQTERWNLKVGVVPTVAIGVVHVKCIEFTTFAISTFFYICEFSWNCSVELKVYLIKLISVDIDKLVALKQARFKNAVEISKIIVLHFDQVDSTSNDRK